LTTPKGWKPVFSRKFWNKNNEEDDYVDDYEDSGYVGRGLRTVYVSKRNQGFTILCFVDFLAFFYY